MTTCASCLTSRSNSMLDTRGMGRFHPGPSDRSTLVTESAFGENRCCGAGELCCSIAAPLALRSCCGMGCLQHTQTCQALDPCNDAMMLEHRAASVVDSRRHLLSGQLRAIRVQQ